MYFYPSLRIELKCPTLYAILPAASLTLLKEFHYSSVGIVPKWDLGFSYMN